jgi:hypothetical protein
MDDFKKKLLGNVPLQPSFLKFEDDLNAEEIEEINDDNQKYLSRLKKKVADELSPACSSSSPVPKTSIDEDTKDETQEYDTDSAELAAVKKRLGLGGKNVYRTKIHIKRDAKMRPIEEPPGMTEEELLLFKKVIAPGMIKNTDSPLGKIDLTYIEDELQDDTDFYDQEMTSDEKDSEEKKLLDFVCASRYDLDPNRAERQIQKIVDDEKYVSHRHDNVTKRHDQYSDLQYLRPFRMFDKKWISAILNDQNIEMPFIYLHSIQVAGLGGVPFCFKSAIYFLEALGMTVTVTTETYDVCKYRAFFSGRQDKKVTDDEITVYREMAKELEKNNQLRSEEGGSGAQTSFNIPNDTYREKLFQESGEQGIEALKKYEWLGRQHLRPVDIFHTKPRPPTEKEKEQKKKDNIMRMELQINKPHLIDADIHTSYDQPEEVPMIDDNYDEYMCGFTSEMINSLENISKYLDMKAQDSLAKKQTELSAWMEKHLCFDIVVVPGLSSEDDQNAKIERQLMFTFNVITQNPYTFMLMNMTMEERKNALVKEMQRKDQNK